MSEYLTSLISISSIVGVCSLVSYGEREDKVLKVASSLILVYVTVMPALTLIGGIDIDSAADITDGSFDSVDDTLIGERAEAAFCDGVRRYVCERFSLSEDDVSVRVIGFSYTSLKAEKIKIILSGKAILSDLRAIAAAVSGSGLGDCEVNINVK